MGNVWGLFHSDSKQRFDKSAHLQYPSSSSHDSDGYSSKFAYYQMMREAAAKMELAKSKRPPSTTAPSTASSDLVRELDGGDSETGDSTHANFMLAHWPRDMDVVFDRNDEFPVSISVEQELDFDLAEATSGSSSTASAVAESSRSCFIVASQEESILNGLSASKLSSSEAIHKAIEKLRLKYTDDPDRFLCILAKYPRATRLFASQQLHARRSVERVFQLHILSQDYAHAAFVAGKLAYGEHASHVKKKLRRLEVMSKLLRIAVEKESALSSTRSSSETTRAPHCSSESADSFSQVMTDEAIALVRCQSSLQSELGVECLVGSSLVETLHKLIALYATHVSALSVAINVAEQFEVHPRQFSWALLKVLAQTEQWPTLLMVTSAVRPAIGYIPVIEVLLDEDHAELAHDLLALIDAEHEREEIMAVLAKYHAHHNTAEEHPGSDNSAGEVC